MLMLKGLRRKAQKLARAAAAALTFLAPRYPALVCAIVAGERLAWGLRRSLPPSQRRARAETFFPYARPRSPWKHPSHQLLFKLGFCCVSVHTRARAAPPHSTQHAQNLSLNAFPLSPFTCVCVFFFFVTARRSSESLSRT